MPPVCRRTRPRMTSCLMLLSALALAACGGDGGTNPLTPSTIARVSADSQATQVGVAMAQPLVVLVTGGDGAPLAGAAVAWTVNAGGGSVSATADTTDAAGHAETVYTPGTAPGAAHVVATVNGLASVDFTITLMAGPPTALQKFGADSPAAVVGSTLALSVKLVDKFGNAIPGGTVTWSAVDGKVSVATSTTDNGGVATTSYTIGTTAGTYALTATYDGLPPITFSIRGI